MNCYGKDWIHAVISHFISTHYNRPEDALEVLKAGCNPLYDIGVVVAGNLILYGIHQGVKTLKEMDDLKRRTTELNQQIQTMNTQAI